jgi:hypothetical protein
MRKIFQGWLRVFFRRLKTERIAKERMRICSTCPLKMKMAGIDVCGACHCPLIAKTRSKDSQCPKGFWSDGLSDNI